MLAPQINEVLDTTGNAIWFFANICYAGMRAQGHTSRAWRVVSFWFGMPLTFVSLWVVQEGSERAYGIDLPKRRDQA